MPTPTVHCRRFALAAAAVLMVGGPAAALPDVLGLRSRQQLEQLNRTMAGKLADYTDNHGADRRVYSAALDAKRDAYVYLPPGYDGVRRFPVMLFLHGLGQDEKIFLDVVPAFDAAIRAGTCPPMVIVVPDGTVHGSPRATEAGSFYINSKAGRFGDYIARDVWPWALRTFAVRPERDAHVIAGASMGGFGAYNVAFKNRDQFGHIAGVLPPLNLRYGDCHGRYLKDYDPDCFALRPIDSRREVVGVFYGVLPIRSRRMLDPIVGRDFSAATAFISRENPYEMLAAYDIRPDEFGMFVGYGQKDEFNMDAVIESFLAEAARRNIFPTTVVRPDGRHDVKTAVDILPALHQWLRPRLGPYTPAGFVPPTPNGYARPHRP